MSATVFLLLAALCVRGASADERADSHRPGHVSVVVVGGTGDLAKKYLWQGFFQLYVNQVSGGNSFSFYGGGLSAADSATPVLFEILKGLTCSEYVSPERCALLKEQFLKLSKYRQLKTLEHYQSLAKHIEQELQQEGLTEAGRLFYLSVPAFAYADIAEKINSSCRPGGGAWLKVVLEKPFGHDLRSAQVLASQLGTSLRDEEMYRIDHYLGKQVSAHHDGVHSPGQLESFNKNICIRSNIFLQPNHDKNRLFAGAFGHLQHSLLTLCFVLFPCERWLQRFFLSE